MSSSIRRVLQIAVVAAAVGSTSLAFAAEGLTGRLAERAQNNGEPRNAQRDQRGNDRAPAARAESRPAPRSEQPRSQAPSPRPQPPREQNARAGRDDSARSGGLTQRLAPRPQPRVEVPPAAGAQPPPAATPPVANANGNSPGRGGDRGSRNDRGNRGDNASGGDRGDRGSSRQPESRGDRGLTGELIQRNYQTRDRGRDNDGRGDGRGRDRDWDRGRDRPEWYQRHRDWHRDHRPGRVIQRLPVGYRSYLWDRHHYYYHGGAWYRPYGSTFISVGVPFGLFVTTLPGSYTSFYYGNTRYYYSDYNYYVYEPLRHGYVVTRSPYGDDYYDESDDYDRRLDQDLYIYPAQGQSTQQQADDRYECHRWAVSETDYDPIDDEYDADRRADYLRAMTACLTGRGYTVR